MAGKRAIAGFVALFAIFNLMNAIAFAGGDFRPNEVLVKYKSGAKLNRLKTETIYQLSGATDIKRFHGTMSGLEQLTLKKGSDVLKTVDLLQKNPDVEYAQPNYILKIFPKEQLLPRARTASQGIPCIPGFEVPGCEPLPCFIPNWPPGCKDDGGNPPGDNPGQPGNPGAGRPPVAAKPDDVQPPVADPALKDAYGIAKISAPVAWNKTIGSQDIIVAVIDTGIDYNHEDLAFNMWRNPNPSKEDVVGWDFIHNDNLPFDDNQHGSHCAGTIGGVGGNGKGVSGVNQRVSLMALKFLSGEGSGDTAGAISAIDYAIEHGARVLSNSWGGGADEGNNALLDAINRAEAKGVLFVAAAGNDGTNNDQQPTYPAAFRAPNMLTVAATDSNDRMAYFSNFGKDSVHVAAPGVDVYSTTPGNTYSRLSGTSMACPHVAGAAALVWSTNPNMSYKEVKQKLMDTADILPELTSKTVTGGRINVARAVGAM